MWVGWDWGSRHEREDNNNNNNKASDANTDSPREDPLTSGGGGRRTSQVPFLEREPCPLALLILTDHCVPPHVASHCGEV